MTKLRIRRTDLEAEIQNNCSTPNGETYIRSDDSSFNWIESGTSYPIPGVEFIPIPASDPEGHGHETERFQEFSEHPPDHCEGIHTYADDHLWDPEYNCYGGRDDYISYAKHHGWDTIEQDWEQWEKDNIDFLIEEWVDGLKMGSTEICHNFEPLENCYEVVFE